METRENLAGEVHAFCRSHGLYLKKHLGQHFLCDASVLRKILEAAAIVPNEHVLEVGPGIGVLTRELLSAGALVTAIELDQGLIPLLEEFVRKAMEERRNVLRQAQHDMHTLNIVHGDALTVPLPTSPYKVVANIPYEITSTLLKRLLLEAPLRPTSMTLLLQQEVAEKILGRDGGNRLNILLGLFGESRRVARVSRGSFLPPPKVESAVLHWQALRKPRADEAVLREVLRLAEIAFQGKRKMLRNTVGKLPGGLERLGTAGIAATRRPETLSIEEWIRLAKP